MLERMLNHPETFALIIPLTGFIGLVYICLNHFFNHDYVVFKTEQYKMQFNLMNWKKPNWDAKLEGHYTHFGPFLKVSNQLYTKRCARGCCASVELKTN